jgi:hypothetical protein
VRNLRDWLMKQEQHTELEARAMPLPDLVSFCQLWPNGHLGDPDAIGTRKDDPTKDEAIRSVDEADLKILRHLAATAARRQHLEDIATATELSRKTVGVRVKRLSELGYATRPEGERGGATITEPGKQLLATDAQRTR